jgi:glycosyltransferase involved in cell wall biosynthesis
VRAVPVATPTIDVSSVGIIALVPDRWGDMWQARHHLLSRIAEQCSVAWMNPAHHWRNILRTRHDDRHERAETPHDTRLRICNAPLWLPRFHGRPRLDEVTLGLRLQAARKSLLRAGARHIVLYIWRPEFAPALGLVPHHLSCYHVDDEYSFSATPAPISHDEMRLLKGAGQVFIHSETMLQAKGGINPHTAHIPNGVDYPRYSAAVPEPEDLRAIPRPRIGYSGWLKPQMDWPLLQRLAERHAGWSFVFVGPVQRHRDVEERVARLRQLPNVHILGGRPSSALHSYVQHFDVCLMPYAIDGYTHFIYPVKVHEYLATGNPVVASALPNLREFADVLSFGGDADEWSCAIARALATRGDEKARDARRAVARRHDWAALAGRVTSILHDRLQAGAPS